MPPAPMPPAPMPPPPPGSQAVDIHPEGPGPAPQPPPAQQPPTVIAAPRPAVSAAPATPLFGSRTRRRSSIRLFGSAAVGSDLVRVNGMTTSLVAGMRLSEVLDLGGGLRLSLDPESLGSGGERHLSVIGFGRFGTHLDLDNAKRFAIALSLDVGAGSNVVVHGSLNFGLRFAPIPNLNIGLLPFNPTFTLFQESSPLQGHKYWTNAEAA